MAILSVHKKELFCHAYIKHDCDRYKRKEIMKDAGYNDNKSYFLKLLNDPAIQGRVLELQQAAADHAVMNLRERLEVLTKIARDEKKPVSQRISALNALHKQSGDDVRHITSDSQKIDNNVIRFVDLKLPAKKVNEKEAEESGNIGKEVCESIDDEAEEDRKLEEELKKLDSMF